MRTSGVVMVVLLVASCATTPATDTPATDATASPTSTARRTATQRPAATERPTATPFGPTGPMTEATVIRVIDGDTIEMSVGGGSARVRYIGIDTPETVDPRQPIAWMGPEVGRQRGPRR